MANTTWPDGEPRNAQPLGGVADKATNAKGQALRHTPDTEPPPSNFGWLDGVKGIVGGPNRAANGPGVNIGPSSALWRKPSPGKYATGDQKKPRR
jgi:hypothetical protein